MDTSSASRIATLEAENARLLHTMEATTAEFAAELRRLHAEIARLTDRVAELLPAARRGQGRRRDPPVVSSPPADPAEAPRPSVDDASQSDAVRAAFLARPRPPEIPPKPAKTPKKRGSTGRQRLPASLTAETHKLGVSVCASCGSTRLDQRGFEVEEKLHAVMQQIVRRVVRRQVCVCRDCNVRTTARSLPAPYERSKVTGEFLAWVLHQKFDQLVPLDRLRRDLARRGVTLAMSTLVSLVERGADLLDRIDGEHWKQLKAGGAMHTDLTGIKVLVPGLERAYDGYIEGFLYNGVAVFQYEAAKDGDRLQSKLLNYEGRLVADAESRSNAVFTSGNVIEGGCNAHGFRKFEGAEGAQPLLASEGGQFLTAMYVAEAAAKERKLAGDELRVWRQTHMGPLKKDFLGWMDAVEPTLLPTDPLAKAVRYYRNHRDALFRFIDDPALPIDNSAMEREFQNWAKLRLNVLFAGSTEGAHRAATIFGIAATCRLQNVHTAAYLAWAFERLGTHKDVYRLPASELTPAAYKRAVQEAAPGRAPPAPE